MATFATTNSAKAWHPDVQGLAPAEIIPDALIIATSSKAGVVEGDEPAVRVPFVNFEGEIGFVPEGADIPEADPDDTEVVIHTGKVAALAKISYEQYSTGTAATLLSDAMRRDLIRKANAAYLAQAAPTGGNTTPPAGLLNLSPTNGGIVADDLDAVVDAIADIEDAGGSATHIIASPGAWAEVSKFKDGDTSNRSLIGAGTDAVIRSLLGVPVLVSNSMPNLGMLVLDQSAILSVYGDVRLAVSSEAYFKSDSIGLRATFRFGAKIADTGRVVKLTVANAGS